MNPSRFLRCVLCVVCGVALWIVLAFDVLLAGWIGWKYILFLGEAEMRRYFSGNFII